MLNKITDYLVFGLTGFAVIFVGALFIIMTIMAPVPMVMFFGTMIVILLASLVMGVLMKELFKIG